MPCQLVFRPVGKGPTLLREYNDQRRTYQELIYARDECAGYGGPAFRVLGSLAGRVMEAPYLLMSSVTGKMRDMFRIANSLIRERVEEIEKE